MTPDTLRDRTLLLVDDEEANLDLLEAFLRRDGYTSLVRTTDARRAVPLLESCAPDLVLLDLHMPHRSGFEVLAEIRARTPPGDYLPVLVLTADITPEARERALSGGARDFLTKPFDAVEVLLRVRNLLETRMLHRAAQAAAGRAALLAEASRVLGASLDSETALAQLARLVVPGLADLCVVELLDGSRLVPAAVAHSDPADESRLRSTLGAVEVAGHPLADLFHGDRAVLLPGAIGCGSDAGLRSVPDRLAPGATVFVPICSAGRPLGGLVLVREGTGRRFDLDDLALTQELARRAALALENARQFAQAQQATQARDRTLAVVAHDLRNPLASIAMGAEMLLHMLPPRGNAYERETLSGIHQSADRMHRLIDDLLNVAQIELGALVLEAEEHDVGDLFAEAEAMLRPLAAARSIRLEFAGCNGLPAARADGVRVIQVLSNLVGNALKFTPPGGSVTVACAAGAGELRISVADTGPGIPAEQLPHLFGAFWQGSRRDHRGVGLGLSIARAIVEAHGGRIWVSSAEGEGSTFHFTLPVEGYASDAPPEGEIVAEVLSERV